MTKIKKIILICSLCCVLFISFAVPSFAQAINGDAEWLSQDNLLLTPRRSSYRQHDRIEDGSYGMTFHTNPLYRPDIEIGERTRVYTLGTLGDFTGASAMQQVLQTVEYRQDVPDEAPWYNYTQYLNRYAQATNDHVYIGQFDYESFYIGHDASAHTAWLYYHPDTIANGSADVFIEFLTFSDADGYEVGSATASFPASQRLFSIGAIYDLARDNGAFTGDSDGIFIRRMTIVNATYDGMLHTVQFESSFEQNYVQQLMLPPLFADPVDGYPNLLKWLSVAVGGFFDTTILEVGNVPIKIGTLFIVPLSAWLIILFLKKFAGG